MNSTSLWTGTSERNIFSGMNLHRNFATALLSALLVVHGSISAAAVPSIPSFPCGTRLSLPVEPEVSFELSADGPSVLWIQVSAPALARVVIETDEAAMIIVGASGMAEGAIPIHRPGKVKCRVVSARSGGRIIVTSTYGLGGEVSVEEMLSMIPMPQKPNLPEMKPASSESPISNPVSAEPVAEIPTAIPTPVIAEPIPHEAPKAEPLMAVATSASLYFGSQKYGVLGVDGTEETRTYRLYVPNRFPFRLRLAGDAVVKIESTTTPWKEMHLGMESPKHLDNRGPDSDLYLVTIRGRGEFMIVAERL